MRLRKKARIKADRVLITTILTAEDPVFFCTAVSMIMLCEQRTITDKIVMALVSRSSVAMTAIAE